MTFNTKKLPHVSNVLYLCSTYLQQKRQPPSEGRQPETASQRGREQPVSPSFLLTVLPCLSWNSASCCSEDDGVCARMTDKTGGSPHHVQPTTTTNTIDLWVEAGRGCFHDYRFDPDFPILGYQRWLDIIDPAVMLWGTNKAEAGGVELGCSKRRKNTVI